ncbi:MAG: acyl-CoA synthetase FdrA [Anaerolineales bacterium]|nr:acyl-CoA synthetase FdrA [Anaerolineales bacterium]
MALDHLRSEVRPGAYYDSAVLMQLQRNLLGLPGVLDAGVVMATPANCELLEQSGLLAGTPTAGPNDLLLVVRAGSAAAAEAALGQVDALLARRRTSVAPEFRPRSLETALRQLPEAAWVLVSVPGRYAAGVAREALDHDRHVFLYSNNVSLADEVALKQTALARGLLVMGPDCGTAIVNGVGLGFANRVRRGPVGLVGASGTGLQAVTSRLHALGSGVSHALGTGGRDLKAEVDAITARQSLDLLARDPDTKVIVIVSKPPAPTVATRLLAAAQAAGKPVVVDFLGYPPPGRQIGNLHFAVSLADAAERAAQLAVGLPAAEVAPAAAPPPLAAPYLRALFSGGTLANETLLGLQAVLTPLFSNLASSQEQQLADPLQSQAHTLLDLGEDVFTVGRLHPMIDNELRLRRLKQEAADPTVGLILLDVVLGEGAHPDPAAELGPAIAAAQAARPELEVVALVVGTDADPQGLEAQKQRLAEAGAFVVETTTAAVSRVAQRLGRAPASVNAVLSAPPVALDRLARAPLAAVNVGLESFAASLAGQGAQVVQLDWRPPAGGNEKMMALLAKMKKGAP